jgi:hypothetical protein
MDRLTELGLKYNTDKAFFHLFTSFYNTYFEKYTEKPIRILELGIFKGGSLKMLGEYFKHSTIYGIDINHDSVNKYYGDNIITYHCSQIDSDKLHTLFKNMKFDIIIDDGSHVTSHQQKSLGMLFPFLHEDGIYVCEDLHTSYVHCYVDTSVSTLQVFENFKKTGVIQIEVIDSEQNKYLNKHIGEIIIYNRTQNALKCYKCNLPNASRGDRCACGVDLSPNDKSITSVITRSQV